MARKQARIPNTIPPQKNDDFTCIKGIGPVLAGRLHERGIHTYSELAALSPIKLAARIPGLTPSQVERQDWLGQAAKLASTKKKVKPLEKVAQKRPARQHYENFTIEFLLDEKNSVRRIRVVHVQSRDTDTWAGWEAEQIDEFLSRHTGCALHRTPPVLKKKTIKSRQTVQPAEEVPQPAAISQRGRLPTVVQAPVIADTAVTDPISVNDLDPIVSETADSLSLRDLSVTCLDSAKPLLFLRRDQLYLLRLTIDPRKVAAIKKLPFTYTVTIFLKRLGTSCGLSEEICGTLSSLDLTTLSFPGRPLAPGMYRLSAFVKLVAEPATPALTAFIKGGLLEVY